MKILIKKIATIMMGCLSFISCSNDDNGTYYENPGVLPSSLSVKAEGTATAKPVSDYTVPGTDLKVNGNLFEMDMYDYTNGKIIGTVKDINLVSEAFEGYMKAENVTILEFDEGQSTIVLHNFIELVQFEGAKFAGFIPLEKVEQNVIGGTGKFEGVQGGSTLAAVLDLSDFNKGTVVFDCLYQLNFQEFH